MIYGNLINGSRFTFYHLLPKGASTENGICSLEWYYRNDRVMFRKYAEKYIERLCGQWGIYPSRKRNHMTDDEIFNGICQQRKTDTGCNQIYFFRYPPYTDLGDQMKSILDGKDVYEIDLSNPSLRNQIVDVDWGYVDSYSRQERLTEKYYRSVSRDDYFKGYTEGNPDRMLFSYLNHISITPKGYCIPKRFIRKVETPTSIDDIRGI